MPVFPIGSPRSIHEHSIPREPFPTIHPPRKQTPSTTIRHRVFVGLVVILVLIIGVAGFFLYKGIRVSQSIRLKNTAPVSLFQSAKQFADILLSDSHIPLRGESSGRINILLLGRAGAHYPGRNLTDTMMLLSIDTTTKKMALLSLPRDLYVPIPQTNLFTKLNSLYQYGQDSDDALGPIRGSLEEITGLPIHYFIVIDFDGFEQAIDSIGGISVDIVRDFYDPRYPGKNYSYELFEIKKGWQTLDGATALKYVRERHNDPDGDFGRARRQQQVLQAIKSKIFSVGTYTNVFALNGLLDTLGKNVQTDIPLEDLSRFLDLSHTLDTENITSLVIDAWEQKSLLRVSHIQVGSTAAFILVPRVGNWSEIRDTSENIFHLDALTERGTAIAAEQTTLTLFFEPSDLVLAQKIDRLMKDEFGFASITLAPATALDKRPEESIIVDNGTLDKPYSFDALLKKFPLRKTAALPTGIASQQPTDFSIIIGNDLADVFSFDENVDRSSLDTSDTAFPKILPPQPQEKNHEK